MKVKATEAVAFLQKPPNDPHVALHVTSSSPLYAKYTTSVDTLPAANITYVRTYTHIQQQFQLLLPFFKNIPKTWKTIYV